MIAADEGAHRHLWVERLRLTDFRNYATLALSLDSRPLVLTGDNGAGKTNLLEAVSLLAAGRGLRGRPFAELARTGGPGGWSVASTVQGPGGPLEIGTGRLSGVAEEAGGSRLVRIAGKPQSGSGALADHVQMVWLTPAMDGLFTGPASERRRFLDRLILAFDARFRVHAARFDRAMRQRNRLFEQGEPDPGLFAALEREMAEAGVAVAAARSEAVARLGGEIERERAGGEDAFPFATLALAGSLEQALEAEPAGLVEEAYARRLGDRRHEDRRAGRALEGPHLSDLKVGHGPKSQPAEVSSSGEQKALLLGLVLAQARAIRGERGGVAPLLLLDEVAAHLDAIRRKALFIAIQSLGAQVWLTGTDAGLFSGLRETARFLTVRDGNIVQ